MAVPETDAPGRRVRLGTAIVIALVVGPLAFVVLTATLPDARDRLSDRERAIAGPVLDGTPLCSAPLARVTQVSFDRETRPRRIRYRCGWTLLGVPRDSAEAVCAERQWQFSNGLDMVAAGSC